jgi:hypothetical protein
VPARAPGDFTVPLGAVVARGTLAGLERELSTQGRGMLSWIEYPFRITSGIPFAR